MKTHTEALHQVTLEHFYRACDECQAELRFWREETISLQNTIRNISERTPGMENYSRDLANKLEWFRSMKLQQLKEELTRHQIKLAESPQSMVQDWEDNYWQEHREMMKKVLDAFARFRQLKKEMLSSLEYLLEQGSQG